MDWDLGDVVASFNLRVKGRQRYGIRLRNSVPQPTEPAERVQQGAVRPARDKGGPISMDLGADQKTTASLGWTDEVGNDVPTPDGATATYASSDTSILAVNDLGDGTAEFVATGALGSAVASVDASFDGDSFHGEETINVVAGMAERVKLNFSEPTEATPDDV